MSWVQQDDNLRGYGTDAAVARAIQDAQSETSVALSAAFDAWGGGTSPVQFVEAGQTPADVPGVLYILLGDPTGGATPAPQGADVLLPDGLWNTEVTATAPAPVYGAAKFSKGLVGGSAQYMGTADPLTTATLEVWVKSTSTTGTYTAVGNYNEGQSIGMKDGRAMLSYPWTPQTADAALPAISDGSWHHLALTVDGTNARLWQDGKLAVTSPSVDQMKVIGFYKWFGIGSYGKDGGQVWAGSLDEVRISKKVRYTAQFTPPTGPFTTDADTLVLLHLEG